MHPGCRIEQELGLSPFASALYVFTNRHRNKIKALYWHRNGFCLWKKRLERDKFAWPHDAQDAAVIRQEAHDYVIRMLEQAVLARQRIFGASSEQLSAQSRLFDEAQALARFENVLEHLPTHKNSQIEELLPHRWQPTKP